MMDETEKGIPVPMSERVKISDLKFDQANPNRMSLAQLVETGGEGRIAFIKRRF